MPASRENARAVRRIPLPTQAPPPPPQTRATPPRARPAGIAPAFDAAAQQLAARTDAPKGMISNPWVRQWASGSSSANPSDVASPLTQEPSPAAEAAPRREARRAASDAGHAPTPKARG